MDRFKLLRVKKHQFQWEEFRGKGSFWTWILRQATRQNFTLISSPTFFYKWVFQWVLLDFKFGWRGAQVEFLFSIFEAERYNSAQALTLGEKISRFRPVDPPTNDTRRYGAKEAYPRLGSLAARQTFFQAVDRLPHPRVRWLAS